MHDALDRVARAEGFRAWSHLAASAAGQGPATQLLSRLAPGDLILLAARPGHGKTRLGLELAAKAGCLGRRGYFFTLDYHAQDVADRLAELGVEGMSDPDALVVDTSDEVSADYVIHRLNRAPGPALAVIDYLQLLDQRRTMPALADQVASLRAYATATGTICAMISQIDRSFDLSGKPMPGISDIRLPNPLDLSVFDMVCFLHDGRVRMDRAA